MKVADKKKKKQQARIASTSGVSGRSTSEDDQQPKKIVASKSRSRSRSRSDCARSRRVKMSEDDQQLKKNVVGICRSRSRSRSASRTRSPAGDSFEVRSPMLNAVLNTGFTSEQKQLIIATADRKSAEDLALLSPVECRNASLELSIGKKRSSYDEGHLLLETERQPKQQRVQQQLLIDHKLHFDSAEEMDEDCSDDGELSVCDQGSAAVTAGEYAQAIRPGKYDFDGLMEIRAASRQLREFLVEQSLTTEALKKGLSVAEKMEDILLKQLLINSAMKQTNNSGCEHLQKVHDFPTIAEARSKLAKAMLAKEKLAKTKPAKLKVKPLPPLYSVVVTGQSNEDPALIKKKLAAVLKTADRKSGLAAVRVKTVREGDHKVVIHTCSSEERAVLTNSAEMVDNGLVATLPVPRLPRVSIRWVPKETSKEELLEELYDRNFGRIMSRDEFDKELTVCSRNEENEKGNVVVELSQRLHKAVMKERKVYVGLESYGVKDLSGVRQCFRCLSLDHIARQCTMEICCIRCGSEGHLARGCQFEQKCRNCWTRNLPSAHSAASTACPLYGRAFLRTQQRAEAP